MTELTQPHPHKTTFHIENDGHHEYPYPYNAWITQILTLTDFTDAFIKNMQQQRSKLPKDIWQEECDIHYALLNKMVQSFDLPKEAAQAIWLSFDQHQTEHNQTEHNQTEHNQTEHNQTEHRNTQHNHTETTEQPTQITQQEITQQHQHLGQKQPLSEHITQILDNTNPHNTAFDDLPQHSHSFSAQQYKIPSQHQRQSRSLKKPTKKSLKGRLIGITAFIVLANISLIAIHQDTISIPSFKAIQTYWSGQDTPAQTTYSQISEPPSLNKTNPLTLTSDNVSSSANTLGAPSLQHKTQSPPTDINHTTQKTQEDATEEDILQSHQFTHAPQEKIIAHTETLNQKQLDTKNNTLLLELMRQAAELNIEPVTDRDTALYYLKQLREHNAKHDILSRAHFSVHNGYEALSTLATARGHFIEAQRLQNRAQSHAVLAQELDKNQELSTLQNIPTNNQHQIDGM